ncbi:hypothetical protein Y032_0013g2075 [Ancylostoma ceylanicum]|nr:hypothetical protein Y032_0013g2075 [Ancylostoma ceylanicum]
MERQQHLCEQPLKIVITKHGKAENKGVSVQFKFLQNLPHDAILCVILSIEPAEQPADTALQPQSQAKSQMHSLIYRTVVGVLRSY